MLINFISRRFVCYMLILVHCVLMCQYTFADKLSDFQVQKIFEEANTLFDEAMEIRLTDRDSANQKFEMSIDRWQQIIDEGEIINGKLYYNIGNANLMRGKLGQAILYYRKAERYIPGDANLVSNLDYARRMVLTRIELETSSRVREVLFFWHYDFSSGFRFWLFSSGFILCWLWLITRLFLGGVIGKGLPRWPAGVFIIVSFGFLGSLITDHVLLGREDQGVITASEVVGRKGPSDQGYEPSFSEALSEGVEFRIVERRSSGWILAGLRDGRTTWLPDAAFEII